MLNVLVFNTFASGDIDTTNLKFVNSRRFFGCFSTGKRRVPGQRELEKYTTHVTDIFLFFFFFVIPFFYYLDVISTLFLTTIKTRRESVECRQVHVLRGCTAYETWPVCRSSGLVPMYVESIGRCHEHAYVGYRV